MIPALITDAGTMAAHGSQTGRYMAAFAREGAPAFIANALSQPMLLHHAGHCLPVTVDEGGYGGSYVVSLHSAYVLYARFPIIS